MGNSSGNIFLNSVSSSLTPQNTLAMLSAHSKLPFMISWDTIIIGHGYNPKNILIYSSYANIETFQVDTAIPHIDIICTLDMVPAWFTFLTSPSMSFNQRLP